ncbi:Kelch-like protein 7 [Oryzias melastigma]|uniref:Kelch-like protein 7 n=1 Tax=Oryzias melastigma TaxID=30732 RepID=A0A834F1A7_ORYME|nr:Kelch-like protein 7 [Oryzias melastigma]
MTGMASPEKASSSKKKGERKCASKEEYRQLSGIMAVMNNLRKQGTLCDVTLVVQGKHFSAHRVVLAAASPFFSLMFTTRMMESMSHEVELRSAEPEIIELLIEFIYTARLESTLVSVVQLSMTIYDAAVRWLKYDVCNRQQYMVEVLGCVRFPLVSKTFLSKTVQGEPLIQDNPQCLKMVISGMRYHLLSLEDREDLGESSRPRRKKHDYRIALFGGSQPQSCRYFNPKDCSWTDIRCPFEKRRDATAVFWDNVVYILGGSQLFPIKRMDCYNVLKDSWYSKLGPPTPRDSLAACASQGKIYTSGGSEVGSSASNLFECYDTRTESWQVKTSMLMARCSHGSVEANGLVYVCGGTVGNNVSGRIVNNCEVYDPNTQKWRELSGMKEARKNHGLVVVNSRIYAVGGQGPLGGLDSVEYYDIASNEWRSAAPMPWRGVTVKCAAVGEVIYVLAGFQGVIKKQ